MPVSTSSAKPSGMLTRLNVVVLNVVLAPVTSSERMGNRVPNNTENAIPTSSRLLKKKLASRLTIDSSRVSVASSGSRFA